MAVVSKDRFHCITEAKLTQPFTIFLNDPYDTNNLEPPPFRFSFTQTEVNEVRHPINCPFTSHFELMLNNK